MNEAPPLIRLADPHFGDAELDAARAVLLSGQLVQGEQVRLFEEAFAEEVGAAHAVMVSSGTSALHLALLALGVGPGDAVAVPNYTFVATANAVALTGATPVLVDVDPATFNMDPEALRRVVRRGVPEGPVRAVLPVHQFGLPAEMDAIAGIAAEEGLEVVEDAACAIGSSYRGRPAGVLGRVSCFSFHPRKVLTTGEGGAVVTDDASVADAARALRAHGFASRGGGQELVTHGFNYRLTEFQAAIGSEQLRKLGWMVARRRELADALRGELADVALFRVQHVPSHVDTNWQSFVGVLDDSVDRAGVIDRLASEGIEARAPATAIHRLGAFVERSRGQGPWPVADHLHDHCLALPLHPYMDAADVSRVAGGLRAALDA